VRTANEARFIIDLDGKMLMFQSVELYRMQVMALLVCGTLTLPILDSLLIASIALRSPMMI